MLEEEVKPFFLKDFLKLSKSFSLNYLGDGKSTRMRLSRFAEYEENYVNDPEIKKVNTRVEKEQYMDYKEPLSFRGTLLTKKTPLENPDLDRIKNLYFASHLIPKEKIPDLISDKLEIFLGSGEVLLELNNPLLKAAYSLLRASWPEAVFVNELFQNAKLLVGQENLRKHEERDFFKQLYIHFEHGLNQLYSKEINLCQKMPEKPEIFNLARHQVTYQNWLINLRSEFVPLNVLDQLLIPLLDGTNSLEDIKRFLRKELPEDQIESLENELQAYFNRYINFALIKI